MSNRVVWDRKKHNISLHGEKTYIWGQILIPENLKSQTGSFRRHAVCPEEEGKVAKNLLKNSKNHSSSILRQSHDSNNRIGFIVQ